MAYSHLLDVISIQSQDNFLPTTGQVNFRWSTATGTYQESMNAQDTTALSTAELIKEMSCLHRVFNYIIIS